MSSPKFETFLALLYTDETFRKTFYSDREKSCIDFGLTEEETEAMKKIDREGLELAASSYRQKRQYAEFRKKQRNPWRRLLRFLGIKGFLFWIITLCFSDCRTDYLVNASAQRSVYSAE